MSKPRRKLDELAFDLESLRVVKRRLRRALRALEAIEVSMVRVRRARQKVTPAEVEAATELYAACSCSSFRSSAECPEHGLAILAERIERRYASGA